MENIQKIRTLKDNSEKLKSYFERYRKTISDPSCDKHHAEFNRDDRFIVFECKVFFSACTGYYGNSGCSTFGHLDREVAREHFMKALNKNKELIFSDMADSMMSEAKNSISSAQKELESLKGILDSVTEEQQS